MESWSCSSATALRALSLKPSTLVAMPSPRWSSVSRLRAGFPVSTFSTSLSVVEYLREVEHADVVPGAPQASLEVHQAAGVARDQGVRPALLQRLDLLVCHRRRNSRHLYGKRPPEPATQLLILRGHEVEPLHVRKQPARLLQYAELAPLVAAAVEDGFPFELCPEIFHAHYVHEEIRELPHALCEHLGTLTLFRQVLEDEGVVVGDHRGTRAGGTYYVVEAFPLEDVEEVASYGAGLVEESRVEGGLTATGLAFGVDHIYPQPPQYAHHAYAYFGIDQIHVAWYEQSYPQLPRPFHLMAASPAKYINANRPGFVMRC